jgi:hypothetical protein
MSDYDELYGGRFMATADVKAPRTATIDRIDQETFNGASRPKAVIYLIGAPKGIVLNKTNATTLARAFGKNFQHWIGKPVTVKAEPTQYQGKPTVGLRLYPAATPAAKSPAPPAPEESEEFNDEIPWK